jgi:hypothetical protein
MEAKKMTHLSRESEIKKGCIIWSRVGDSNGHLYTDIRGCMKNIALLKEWVDPRNVKSPPPASVSYNSTIRQCAPRVKRLTWATSYYVVLRSRYSVFGMGQCHSWHTVSLFSFFLLLACLYLCDAFQPRNQFYHHLLSVAAGLDDRWCWWWWDRKDGYYYYDDLLGRLAS